MRRLLALEDMSRFHYAMLASLLIHAFVVFGIVIRPPDLSKLDRSMQPLEVVLVNAKSSTKPVTSDLLGQHNLDGGGNTDADRRAKTPLPVTRNDAQTTELSVQSRRVEQLEEEARKLMTLAKSQAKVSETPAAQPQPNAEPSVVPSAADIMNSRNLEIQRLEAQIGKDLDAYQKRPRKHFVGGRVKEYRFARYEEDFRIKVERIGEVNYPQAARDHKIFGSLRLTVLIKSDGSVESIEVNRSSGQKILDEAAVRIVRLGEPYAAFPSDIAKDVDILGITRTWKFTRADQLVTE
jgi:protein TonB